MSTPSAYLDANYFILLREKLLLLGLINTLQPVTARVLLQNLPKGIDWVIFKRGLRMLREEQLVVQLWTREFIVTSRGTALLGSGLYAKERDIARMLHLFQRSKEGGNQP